MFTNLQEAKAIILEDFLHLCSIYPEASQDDQLVTNIQRYHQPHCFLAVLILRQTNYAYSVRWLDVMNQLSHNLLTNNWVC